jgi:hypothetical protein
MAEVQGIETAVCDSSLWLVLFRTHIKQRLDRSVKTTCALVPDSRIGYSHLPGLDGALSQGNSIVFAIPRGNAELSVSGNYH